MSALSSWSLEKHSSALLTVFCEAEIPEDEFRRSLLNSEMCSDASLLSRITERFAKLGMVRNEMKPSTGKESLAERVRSLELVLRTFNAPEMGNCR
jgi:hypothetical protein